MCEHRHWKTIESSLHPETCLAVKSEQLSAIHMTLQQAKTAIMEPDLPPAFRQFVCSMIDLDIDTIRAIFSEQT